MNKMLIWVGKFQKKKESQSTFYVSIEIFLRLELQIIRNGVSWFEIKSKIHLVVSIAYIIRPDNFNLY